MAEQKFGVTWIIIMNQGTLISFLKAQGLGPKEAGLVKPRFQCWLRNTGRMPTPLSRPKPNTKIYSFESLAGPWSEYTAMRAAMGRGIVFSRPDTSGSPAGRKEADPEDAVDPDAAGERQESPD